MTATAIEGDLRLDEPAGDAVLGWLEEARTVFGWLAAGEGCVDAATRIERIAALEKIKAAAAAAQLAEVVRFAQSQVAEQHVAGVDYRRLGKGIGDQIGMATKAGPWHGARRLTIARDLWQELPGCFGLLAAGEISEHLAGLLVTETSHLDPETRRAVDAQLVAARVDQMAPRKAAGTARRLAYAADPEGSVRRARIARKDRRVSLRPLPDTMAGLSAFLPVEQGVACWAALKARVDALKAAGDPRTRSQIAADTLVERLTGQATADDVDVEVQIIVPVENLLDPDQQQPAEVHRVWADPGRTGRSDHRPHQWRAVVAAAVHRTDPRRPRQHDRRRGSGRAPVHRLAGQVDHTSGSLLPGTLLHSPDPARGPHHSGPRWWPHQL